MANYYFLLVKCNNVYEQRLRNVRGNDDDDDYDNTIGDGDSGGYDDDDDDDAEDPW